MIINLSVIPAAMLPDASMEPDAYEVLLDLFRNHGILCSTEEEDRWMSKQLALRPTSRSDLQLKATLESMTRHVQEKGISDTRTLEGLQRLPKGVAILDALTAVSFGFDPRASQTRDNVKVAQVGRLRECKQLEELRINAEGTILGDQGSTLIDFVEPIIRESSVIEIFDPYIFDFWKSPVLKPAVRDFLSDILKITCDEEKDIEITIFTLRHHNDKAIWEWMSAELLLEMLDKVAFGERKANITMNLRVCDHWFNEAKDLMHDRFVQFMMRKTNKRRVVSLGRGLEVERKGRSVPTVIKYYGNVPKSIVSHLDHVRRIVTEGSLRKTGFNVSKTI